MNNQLVVRGVITPILTPLTGRGRIDEAALQAHVVWLIGQGIHGLMPCGTTGEGPLLTLRERQRVLDVVMTVAAHRVPVLAHVGTATTAETVALARHAAVSGAEAVSVVTPYFYRVTPEALIDHFCRVAEAVPDTPVFLYNIPQNTGNHLTPAVAASVIARCPNVIGVKDSSGDLATLSSYLGLNGGRFQVVCGSDSMLFAGLQAGAIASVSGNSNIFPEILVGLFEDYWRGDLDGARRWQQRLDVVRDALGDGRFLSLMKWALEQRGLACGPVRAPLPVATPEMIAHARAVLAGAGLPLQPSG